MHKHVHFNDRAQCVGDICREQIIELEIIDSSMTGQGRTTKHNHTEVDDFGTLDSYVNAKDLPWCAELVFQIAVC